MHSQRENDSEERPSWILPVIIISQFAGTSLWFASNAVLPDLQREWGLAGGSVGITTSAVQLGFIIGTLAFAFFTIADRFSPRTIFFACSLLGALFNLLIVFSGGSLYHLLVIRFLTGLCLAGIYPVGMKIAYGWYRHGLGTALGYLVGALVVGTAFPHLLRASGTHLQWQTVIYSVSALSFIGGGLMLLLVPDGPNLAKGSPFDPKALRVVFRSDNFRSAAFGYFGHMWELYTFYAFVPLMLTTYTRLHEGTLSSGISFWSFIVIAAGSLGCIGGGILSRYAGNARVAWVQLLFSGLLCCFSPMLFHLPPEFFLSLMIFWGLVVVGDSPQFSSMIARNAPHELVGSALTICNSIGFAITIVSIECLTSLMQFFPVEYLFLFLVPGPMLGLVSSWQLSFGKERGS